jgi:hypothetical protein
MKNNNIYGKFVINYNEIGEPVGSLIVLDSDTGGLVGENMFLSGTDKSRTEGSVNNAIKSSEILRAGNPHFASNAIVGRSFDGDWLVHAIINSDEEYRVLTSDVFGVVSVWGALLSEWQDSVADKKPFRGLPYLLEGAPLERQASLELSEALNAD